MEGDSDENKRRNISDSPPPLISLDEISDRDSESDADTDSLAILENKDKDNSSSTLTVDEKVDKLIDRMDRFLDCFNSMQKSSKKQQKGNDRKFKHLERGHNELISKVVNSAEYTDSRLDSLEERLLRSENMNKDLTDKISKLESNHDRQTATQHSINVDTAKKISSQQMNLGYTQRHVLDLASEVKERKITISRVYESREEDVITVAIECINKVINAAIANIHPDDSLGGLRILMPQAIDNVYRIGRFRPGRIRNICVTFLRKDEKDMVCRACASTKGDEDIKFFISDDMTQEGRAVKAQLKRITNSAKAKGHEAKISGNKVVINSRVYASNEVKLIPKSITTDLKEEKSVDGGIAYRGDRSIFSNFFPAPFSLGGNEYAHTEQYYQHLKATHHGEDETAERILQLTNPWRIKVLGDSIEQDDEWKAKRMKVMYDANAAKFRQNWPLHDELLRTCGLKLYEATTDMYWACGIGYDSKKWTTMDWKGDNVAGLIVMKVRDELLKESTGQESGHNTLTQIACDNVTSDHIEMDHDDSPLESTLIQSDHHSQNSSPSPANTPAARGAHIHSQHPLYADVIKAHDRPNDDYSSFYQRGHSTHHKRANYRGARGYSSNSYSSSAPMFNRRNSRGRGRFPYPRGSTPDPRRYQDKMSKNDIDFLIGSYSRNPPSSSRENDGYITPKKTVKSPRNTTKPNSKTDGKSPDIYNSAVKLTDLQRQGLIDLGLAPDSVFVKSATASVK